MLENKENPLNGQGKPCIRFANPNYVPDKPSKPAVKRCKVRRQVEDIQHNKEYERLWANL